MVSKENNLGLAVIEAFATFKSPIVQNKLPAMLEAIMNTQLIAFGREQIDSRTVSWYPILHYQFIFFQQGKDQRQPLLHSLVIPWLNVSHFLHHSLMNPPFSLFNSFNGADGLPDSGHFEGNFSKQISLTSWQPQLS
jgi:hypothetical protein